MGAFITDLWYVDLTSSGGSNYTLGWKILMFFPFFNFNKFIQDVLTYTLSKVVKEGYKNVLQPGKHFGYSELTMVKLNIQSK